MLKIKLETFLEFEQRNQLFDLQYKGVYYWHLIRLLFYEHSLYAEGSKLLTPEDKSLSLINVLKAIKQIFKSLISSISKYDLFFMRTEGVREVGNQTVDPYFFYLDDMREQYVIHEHAKSCVDSPQGGSNLAPITVCIAFYHFLYKLYTPKIPGLSNMIKEYNKTFKREENYAILAKYVGLSVSVFGHAKKYYYSLLNRGAKCVLFKCYYDRLTMALIAAAREAGIPSIELQHGLMGKYHLAYQIKSARFDYSYYPDIVITYGRYWSMTAHMPQEVQMIDAGYPLLDQCKQLYCDVDPDPYQIIVYSSGPDEGGLCEIALELGRILPSEYKVFFKVHPRERNSWKIHYPKLAESKDVQCVDAPITVYELFSKAKHHVGTASTVLFEALPFNVNIYVWGGGNYDYMDDIIASGDAVLFDTASQLAECMENRVSPRAGREDEYFKSGAKARIISKLEEFLQEQ